MVDGLKIMGIDCILIDDGIIIEGKGYLGEWGVIFIGGEIELYYDYCIVMSFLMVGLCIFGEIKIIGIEMVVISFLIFM